MKIVFLEPLGFSVESIEKACDNLKRHGHDIVIFSDKSPELNVERAEGADIVVQTDMPMGKDFFDSCPTLKMLAIAIVGLDHVDLDYCEKHGVIVKNAAGYSTEAVAELAIGMMIGLYRHIVENDDITRRCGGNAILPGREIGGKKVGIIGLGAIGRRTAELARAFGCDVLAWNRKPIDIEGVTLVDKETLLKESDIVSLHIALNEETRNFISAKELAMMKKSAVIINTARGGLVNTDDLAEALKTKKIAGAALDVYDGEPPLYYGLPPIAKDNPLLSAPNTILLPHIGFGTVEAKELRLKLVIENIEKFANN
ncbi:MAG: NAD(P)-binding domain-containing protein [Bacteroidales bacterium]|nr:NAD(P)-binding domain-containing protein [Bacteroidales bacterium]